MTDIVISILAVGDAEIVACIHALCFDEDWDAATIKKVLAMPGAFGFAARTDPASDIAGFALARIVADKCELLSLGVAPNWRGLGIGGGLFDAAMVRACALNAARFYLEVAEDNAPAIALYQQTGFAEIGRRKNYYRRKSGRTCDALVMERSLGYCALGWGE